MYATGPAPSTLIGRERELTVLRAHLSAALAGRGSVVLIGGEAGIGKTTLADAVCEEATTQGARVLSGRCFDLTETPPYGPWLSLFARYRPADDLPPLPAAFANRGTVGAVTSQAALFQQVLDFFTALATASPLILLLDDLHWADPASIDLLRVVAREFATLPVLLLAAYRADELTRHHRLYTMLPTLVREAPAVRLDLRPLDADAVRSLVTGHYALPAADGTRLVAYLQERAEGNPFFLGEFCRSLEAEGVLQQADNDWRLAPLTSIPVPPLLRQIIAARFGRLARETQQLLAVAAVIGQEVPLALWSAVAAMDERTLLDVVEAGIEAHLLAELPDGSGVRFLHALIREALYEETLATRRRPIHCRVAEALIAAGEPDPDAVAYHLRQAGDERTARWLIAAGERAQRAYAWLTAAARYEAAIALLPERGTDAAVRGWLMYRLSRLRRWDNVERSLAYLEDALQVGETSDDRALAALARYTRGIVRYNAVEEYAEGLNDTEAAVAAMETLTPAERERIRPYEPGLAAFPRTGLFNTYIMTGRYRAMLAIERERTAQASTRAGADPTTGVSAGGRNAAMAGVYWDLGRVAEAREAMSGGLEHARAGRNYHRLTQMIIFELAELLTYASDRVTERRRLAAEGEEAARRAQAVGYRLPPGLVALPVLVVEGSWDEARPLVQLALTLRGDVYHFLAAESWATLVRGVGDVALAWRLVHDALPDGVTTEPGINPYLYAQVGQRLAVALCLDAGDLPQARAWLDAHEHWLAWSGAVVGKAAGQALWGTYYRAVGDAQQAEHHARQALADATEPRQPLALLAAHRLLGELATDAGRFADAASDLANALALADACADPYERALSLLALAELHATTGNRTEAVTVLDEMRSLCGPLGAKPARTRADELAARVTSMPASSPAYPAGLSAREVEVLRLLAAGHTNQEIADTLFVSVHTVRAHLRNILSKTDTTSRAAAVAFAFQHGLH
jgi:DNA-binding CsgD family transcriptional regulator/tetratricopeptide (TPR) repeat protein